MIMNIYTIKDVAANQFGPVFEAANDRVATRNFRELCKDSDYFLDFSLYCIAECDHETGEVRTFGAPDEPIYTGWQMHKDLGLEGELKK